MKYWEFLIQKEGDDSWLPLETHQVEILEGRYRVVAHTDRTDTPIDISVSQLSTAETPPRQRVRHHTGQTNSAGLAVVIPYVHLKPGQWELICSRQGAATDAEAWQYAVQLQVFGADRADRFSDRPVVQGRPDSLNSVRQSELSIPANPDLPLVHAQKHLQMRLQDNLGSSLQNDSSTEGLSVEERSIGNTPAYRIALLQQAFLSQNGRPMIIVGQVQSLAGAFAERRESQLWLRLQNPKNGQAIMEAHRPINLDRLPADFKVKIQLPTHLQTQIVWGEVSLRSASDGEQSGAVISSAAFTITAGISQLLDDIANGKSADREELEFEDEPSASDSQESTGHMDDISLENGSLPLAMPPLNGSAYSASPAVGVVPSPQADQTDGVSSPSPVTLPNFLSPTPLIVSGPPTEQPNRDRQNRDRLELQDEPFVEPRDLTDEPVSAGDRADVDASIAKSISAPDSGKSRPVELPPMVAKPAQFMGTSIEDDDLETDQIAALLENINDELETVVPAADSFGSSRISSSLSTTPNPSDQQPDDTALPPTEPDNPYHRQKRRQKSAKAAFKSLKLGDHFMQRLSELTHDEISQTGRFLEDLQAAAVDSNAQAPDQLDDAIANSEVVIFDEPPAAVEDMPVAPAAPLPAYPPQRKSLPAAPAPAASIPKSSIPEAAPTNSSPQPSAAQSSPQDQGRIPYSVQLPPQLATGLPATSDVDRNRQLRLARLRQRQAEARAASTAASTTEPTESSSKSLPSIDPSAWSPVSSSSAGAIGPAGAIALHHSAQRFEDDLPEMVLPIISVPVGDLVAGSMVTITVRTRPSVFRPYIKLWMIDRQSRTVVGEPKLLTNLSPDALGDLQTSTELLVPMDCLDVQIAAIAIDMATQQESNKAIVNRHVIPPMQSLSLLRSFKDKDW